MLVVLALLWAAFIVWALRGRIQAGFGDPVVSFRRDLHILERSAPATMAPANRLRVARAPTPAPIPARGSMASQPARGGMDAAARRRQTAKRRRDVLFLLLLTVVATLVMAVATRSHALIALQLFVDVILAGYVGLLVRLRNLSAERELKLRYISGTRSVSSAGRAREQHHGEMAFRRAAAN